MSNSQSQGMPEIEQQGAGNTSPQPKRPKLRLTIPNRHPTATSSNTSTQPTKDNVNTDINARTAADNQPSQPQQHPQVFEEDIPPDQNAPIFREVDYNRGKTDPSSSISEHSPLSASLGRIAWVGHAEAGEKEIHDNEKE
ncbi:MAG: hypothetical protein Q9171_002087 [Xanthocarpia ochracea]